MTTALQQQVFALDAKYNANRAPKTPNFRTLYIRRRSQLLRDTDREPEAWKQYIRTRALLLQQKYGSSAVVNTGEGYPAFRRSISKQSFTQERSVINMPGESVVPTKQAEASKAMVGGNTIGENYAFVGVHHIFDQHTAAVTTVKFANNDKHLLCCSSVDGKLSICDVGCTPPKVIALLEGHSKAVSAFDWSNNNDSIASTSLDGTMNVWNSTDHTLLRSIKEPNSSQLLCCIFQPGNNNLVVTGNSRGEMRIANVSTGRFLKSSCRIGGNVLSLAAETSGNILWAGNDKGEIVSVQCDLSGNLQRTKRLTLGVTCSVTCLNYRAWISREARDPTLLMNCSNNALCLFSVVGVEGELQLKRKFQNHHQRHLVKSIFCPIMSFRQGACIVTGSEEGSVYFLDIERAMSKACVNTLQGHASAVLGVTFNYDESLLATSDLEGLVIVWKRAEMVG